MPRPTHFPDAPNQVHVAVVFYDFEVDGGGDGSTDLPGVIPSGALIHAVFLRIFTALESSAPGDTDVELALTDGGPGEIDLITHLGDVQEWNEGVFPGNMLRNVLTGDAETISMNPQLVTADMRVRLRVSGDTSELTAGKLAVYIHYVMATDMLID